MPNKIKILILIILFLAVIFLVANLVWGKTIRMAKANQLFIKSQTDKAKTIYEDLAVDMPKSPYVLHNLGLSYYKQEENDRAAEYYKNSLKELESVKQSQAQKKENLYLDYYHLGSAQFQSAAKNAQGQSGVNLYQEALDNFQKAIENNPKDLDAKYNYELTKLRLQAMEQQKSPNQDQNKDKDKKDKNEEQKQNENKGSTQEESNPETKQQKEQLSKEEVESLLKMNENNVQYQAPVIIDNNQVPEKDW